MTPILAIAGMVARAVDPDSPLTLSLANCYFDIHKRACNIVT